MTGTERAGRPNQRTRTRKDLLQAAARLLKQGRTPTLDEVAEEALVSRATVYRYFPSVEALLVETAVDVAVPEPGELFRDETSRDPVARLLLFGVPVIAFLALGLTRNPRAISRTPLPLRVISIICRFTAGVRPG